MGHPGRVSFSVESFRSSTKPNEEIPARREPCEIASTLGKDCLCDVCGSSSPYCGGYLVDLENFNVQYFRCSNLE